MKETVKLDNYLGLSKKLKKPWNMLVTVIPIIIGVLETVLKGLEKRQGELEVKGRIKTI